MFTSNAEYAQGYPMQIFRNQFALDKASDLLKEEGFYLMVERSNASSVPPFLGDIINQYKDTVTQQLSLRQEYVSSQDSSEGYAYGGSRLLPTVNLETTYRVFKDQFPTEYAASYALVYATGIANAKTYNEACAKNGAILPVPFTGENYLQTVKDLQRWNSIRNQAEENTKYYGGIILFMESFAENPEDLLKSVIHYVFRKMSNYPSARELERIRKRVDHYFDDRSKLAGAFMEAQRLQIPYNTSLE